jgi:hypothetical protein
MCGLVVYSLYKQTGLWPSTDELLVTNFGAIQRMDIPYNTGVYPEKDVDNHEIE